MEYQLKKRHATLCFVFILLFWPLLCFYLLTGVVVAVLWAFSRLDSRELAKFNEPGQCIWPYLLRSGIQISIVSSSDFLVSRFARGFGIS